MQRVCGADFSLRRALARLLQRRTEVRRRLKPAPRRAQLLLRNEYNLLSMRSNRRSPTMAGVACAISSNGLTCSNSNFWPAAITNVLPSSLRQKILPLYAHGDDVNAPPFSSRAR